jgi:DNA-binding NarL/FixJ family response regulator
MNISNFIVADYQDLSFMGFKYLIEQMGKQNSVFRVLSKADLKESLSKKQESLVVFDFEQFDWHGVEELLILAKEFPAARWLSIMEQIDDKLIAELMTNIPEISIEIKSASKEELAAAISAASQGKKYYGSGVLDIILGNRKQKPQTIEDKHFKLLTNTEREIIQLLAQGKTSKDIANERCLSYHTVITHRKNIFRKLEINTVHELTKYALKMGLVDLTEYYI